MQLAENKNVIFPGKCKMMIMSNIVLNIRVWDQSLTMGGRGGEGGYKTGGVGASQVLPLQREGWGRSRKGFYAMLKVGTTNPKINVFF